MSVGVIIQPDGRGEVSLNLVADSAIPVYIVAGEERYRVTGWTVHDDRIWLTVETEAGTRRSTA